MAHWLTNRGKLRLLQGGWDLAGASAIRIGLLAGSSVPAAIDTEAEIQDLNFVSELLALSGVAEAAAGGGWYSRKNLARTNAAEDDTNNRVNLVASNVTWTAAAAGQTIYGGFWYDATTDTSDATRQLMGLITLGTPIPTNGSDITLTLGDFVRAV